MPTHDRRPTPPRHDVDLTRFFGQTVLGEPRAVLASALLRLRFRDAGHGMAELDAVLLQHEAEALLRAMGRVEDEVPDDPRTEGQRDCDRLLAVVELVLGVRPDARAG